MTLHTDELPTHLAVAHRLLAATPYTGLPLHPLSAHGSSNVHFRLGDDLLLRMPRQPGGSAAIAKEARWLPTLRLPTATPEIVYVGDPTDEYPARWSILRWIEGDHPAAGSGGTPLARDLAEVVERLRSAAVPPAALGDPDLRSYRAGPFAAIDRGVEKSIAACHGLPGLELDLVAAERLWARSRGLSDALSAPMWLHGDLVAENLLVHANRLHAVLDFGTLSVGDPTADLVVAWEVLDDAGRATFRRVLRVDDEAWLRSRAWAVAIAVITLPYYWHTMPRRCHDRLVMASAALSG